MSQDEDHLNVLSVLHYVLGGLMALGACVPLVYVGLGIAMLCGAFEGESAPPPQLGWLFIGLGSVFVLGGWVLAVFVMVAGRKLRRRASRTFCLVIAGFECIITPLGTVLGVFTIIVLSRQSVKQLFSRNRPMGTLP